MALILSKAAQGTLLPLHVLSDREALGDNLTNPITPEARLQQTQLLAAAETIAHAANAKVETIGRVDDRIDRGIVRTAVERNASLIVCGWKGYSTYRENFFGGTLDNVAMRASVPVLIARFTQPIATTARVFLAITKRQALSTEFESILNIAKLMAAELKASLQILVIFNHKQSQLSPVARAQLTQNTFIAQAQGNFIEQVSSRIHRNDLLLLVVNTSKQKLHGRSAVGAIPEAPARSHRDNSVVVLHFAN